MTVVVKGPLIQGGKSDHLQERTEPTTVAADSLEVYATDQNGHTVIEVKGPIGTTRRLARDNFIIAKVDEAAGVSMGDVVYISGANGANELIKLARADSAATMPAFGFCLESGAQNAFIKVIFSGKLSGFSTSGLGEGAPVFVSPTTAGKLTATPPGAPDIRQRVAVVMRDHGSQGEVLVQVTHAIEAATETAGGDLAGTYPNPTVTQARGLRETFGPTTLVMGAVVDGEFLRRVGSEIVSASPGAGSTDIKQTEIDFGTTPTWEKSFIVADAGVSGSSQLMAQVAYEAPTGRDLDEVTMEPMNIRVAPGTSQFTLWVQAIEGPLHGKFKINYLVG